MGWDFGLPALAWSQEILSLGFQQPLRVRLWEVNRENSCPLWSRYRDPNWIDRTFSIDRSGVKQETCFCCKSTSWTIPKAKVSFISSQKPISNPVQSPGFLKLGIWPWSPIHRNVKLIAADSWKYFLNMFIYPIIIFWLFYYLGILAFCNTILDDDKTWQKEEVLNEEEGVGKSLLSSKLEQKLYTLLSLCSWWLLVL